METTASLSRRRAARLSHALDAWAIGGWALGFAVVLYLAAAGGGYDPVVRGELGVAVWWMVLAGVLGGVFSLRFGRLGWAATAMLAGFALWTGLAVTWSESAERTVAELARVTTYAGILVLGLLTVARRPALPLVAGAASAFAVVAALALGARLLPSAFPVNDHLVFLSEAANRLSYPLNYWNGLAAFSAIGFAVAAGLAAGVRSRPAQWALGAALPAFVLCVYFTASRGGALELAVAVLALLVVSGDRLASLATLVTAAAGGAILVAAASQRDALLSGIPTAAARAEGQEVLVLLAIVCAGTGLVQVAIGLAAHHLERPAWMRPSPRRTAAIAAVTLTAGLGAALAAGGAGWAQDRFDEFRSLGPQSAPAAQTAAPSNDTFSRLRAKSVSGNGRWQYWMSAVDSMQARPLQGTGPGTFEFWWARNASIPSYVRDAHSVYFETLGESGIPGIALLGGFVLLVLGGGIWRALRAAPAARAPLAACVAGCAVFAVAAAVDWVWELAVLPAAFVLLAAVALTGRPAGAPVAARPAPPPWRARALLALLAVLALLAIAIPLAGASALRSSQSAAGDGRLATAFGDASTAERTQPYAATPNLQQALVLELAGDVERARAAAVRATEDEPTHWRTWLVRSRLEARAGRTAAAVDSFRRAKRLNPQSVLFRSP